MHDSMCRWKLSFTAEVYYDWSVHLFYNLRKSSFALDPSTILSSMSLTVHKHKNSMVIHIQLQRNYDIDLNSFKVKYK